MWWWMLAACSPESVTDPAGTDASGETAPPAFTGRPLSEPSGSCPAFAEPGTQSFTSNGLDREVEAYWPVGHEGPIGAVFAWHGLGDSASNFARALDLEDFANRHGVLVLVPASLNPNLVTWQYLSGGGDDLVAFHDLRACAAQSFDLDLARVSTFGFSFGALWTTFLTMEAGDTLAASVTFSGGVGDAVALDFTPPPAPTPVLVAWGGSYDVFDAGFTTIYFEDTSLAWADALDVSGHSVVRCDHGLRHTLPPEWEQLVGDYLLGHRYGEPSPFADGNLPGFPDYCAGS